MSLEREELMKEIGRKQCKLYYINNRDKLLAKHKEYNKTHTRIPWSRRADNPKNINKGITIP